MPIISKSGNISHKGCVIKMERKDYRAMSDVYTEAEYALIWLPEEERTAVSEQPKAPTVEKRVLPPLHQQDRQGVVVSATTAVVAAPRT